MNTPQTLALTALLLGGSRTALAQGDRLSLYGFFDLELEGTNRPGGPPWTFDQHHFNVISIYHLDDHWRVFAEIEWEHGASIEGGAGTGEVTLERAALEYKRTDAFQVKVGKFLPPFGLYNLRHDATPTFLSTALPSSVYAPHPSTAGGSQRLFAKFGTGVQVLGNVFAGGWEGEYYVYLTNGRGPTAHEQDNNRNKGVGGRVVIHVPDNALELGASYYADRNGEAADTRQRSLALYVTARFADFLVEAEAVAPRLERVDAAGRPTGTFRTGRGYYAQVSHPVLEQLTPFARYDSYDPETGAPDDRERDVVVGLNLAATGAVFFKAEVHFLSFEAPAQRGYEVFLGSVAVAF